MSIKDSQIYPKEQGTVDYFHRKAGDTVLYFRAPQDKTEAGFQMSFQGYTVTYEILAVKSVAADVPDILKLFALKYCEFIVNQSHMIY